jgi:hypothetical protein
MQFDKEYFLVASWKKKRGELISIKKLNASVGRRDYALRRKYSARN